MQWRSAVLLVALAGCSFKHGAAGGGGGGGDGPPPDEGSGSQDTGGGSADAVPCFGTLAQYCLTTVPDATVTISTDIDTDTSSLCSALSTAECAVPGIAITVTIGSDVHVTGSKPLVLVAEQELTISGTLDASSTRVPAQIGAAADFATCPAASAAATGNGQIGASHTAGGGGAGGSFGDNGGDGGKGAGNRAGGTHGAKPTTNALHGGCAGEDGGPSPTNNAGIGGHSGGAIYLVAGGEILVDNTGIVFADGEGGGAGQATGGGGGGGGSGGLIALEAPQISVLGFVVANGGGGGGAGGTASGGPGIDAVFTTYDQQAGGGPGADSSTGDGGPGGDQGTTKGTKGVDSGGGGGGGGGGGAVGVIWVKGTLDSDAHVSPPPTQH